MEPVFEYSRRGFSLTVYPNRIDIEEGVFAKKSDSILLRNVNDVSVTRTKRLRINTSDGKSHEYLVAGDADKARAAILSVLS